MDARPQHVDTKEDTSQTTGHHEGVADISWCPDSWARCSPSQSGRGRRCRQQSGQTQPGGAPRETRHVCGGPFRLHGNLANTKIVKKIESWQYNQYSRSYEHRGVDVKS